MEFEFDKEIDLLLRQAAQGGTVSTVNPQSNHLDADELAAFADNALPEKTRLNYISHLADCDRCRKRLSNLIALNSETQNEIIHAEEAQSLAAIAPEIPWYRKFFAVPTLAYAMGGLILLFAGIGVFTVLQNNSRSSEVSRTYEKQPGGKGMASDGDATAQETYRSNQMSANTAANSAVSSNMATTASNSAPPAMANSNAAMMRREAEPNSDEARKDDKSLSDRRQPQETESSAITAAPAPPPPPPPAKQSDNNFDLDEQENNQPPSSSQNAAGQTQTAQNKSQITPDTQNVPRAPSPVARSQKEEQKQDAAKLSLKRKTADTTVVGGKTFNRANNAWVDATYRGQATTNVSRGTNEYKKLDSGLRGIAENLGGTVVIVWKEKAYRIQ